MTMIVLPVYDIYLDGSTWLQEDYLDTENLNPAEDNCTLYSDRSPASPGPQARPVNLQAVLEMRTEQSAGCSANLCLSRGRLLGLFFGMLVMALILVSYVLPAVERGQLPTPFQYIAVPLNQTSKDNHSAINAAAHCHMCAANFSCCRTYQSIHFITDVITSAWESSERKLPDLADLKKYEPHMFSVIPNKYLPISSNPCWYEEYRGDFSVDPYGSNAYALYSTRFRSLFEQLRKEFRKHLVQRGDKHFRMRCLPHFFIIGQPKCGTTDLYDRLRLHPAVSFSPLKEPHWWTRKRFGIIRLREGFSKRYPVEDYLDLFDLSAHQLQDLWHNHGKKEKRAGSIIIGEASASTLWDNNAWTFFYGNTSNGEPPVLIQDFIHAMHPQAKFIVMLRDPAERLYSDYLYFALTNKSAEDFQEKVVESLQLFENCLHHYSLRACAYNNSLNDAMPVRLQVGLYVVFLWDWLSIFQKEQFLVLRLEDHATNVKYTMNLVFNFLNLGPVSERQEEVITRNPASNARRAKDRSLGPMLDITRQILRDFYHPFNQKLASLLEDDNFLW